jgi:hypothetical protein
MDKEIGKPKRSTKGNTRRKIRKGGRSKSTILERGRIKGKRGRILGIHTKIRVVGLVETWVEERSWKKIEKTLPKDSKWKSQWAKREKKKGRATGGIITRTKLGIKEKSQERGEEEGRRETSILVTSGGKY